MFTEEPGTGFFTKMKNVFSNSEKFVHEEVSTAELSYETNFQNSNEGPVETPPTPTPVFTYTSRVSDESVTE